MMWFCFFFFETVLCNCFVSWDEAVLLGNFGRVGCKLLLIDFCLKFKVIWFSGGKNYERLNTNNLRNWSKFQCFYGKVVRENKRNLLASQLIWTQKFNRCLECKKRIKTLMSFNECAKFWEMCGPVSTTVLRHRRDTSSAPLFSVIYLLFHFFCSIISSTVKIYFYCFFFSIFVILLKQEPCT